MDLVLAMWDQNLLTPFVYPQWWKEDEPIRQIISLFVISIATVFSLYFLFSTLNFYLVYDRRLLKHPLILENQIQREIKVTVSSMPWTAVPVTLFSFLEVRGYSKLYDKVDDTRMGLSGVVISVIAFILFADFGIYWIHRFLHHKTLYKHIHKIHHIWKIPTPFASQAFHPVDAFLQAFPLHVFPFIFPMHKITYLAMVLLMDIWTVSTHDCDVRVPDFLKSIVNGSAHHTDHHLFYNYNYGQFFTFWDRVGGSFRNPSMYEGEGPLNLVLSKDETRHNKKNGLGEGNEIQEKKNFKKHN